MITFTAEREERFIRFLCGANNREILEKVNTGRQDWCPLKEIPQKKLQVRQLEEPNSVGSMTSYGCAVDRYAVGYNDCINDILEECEEDVQ